MVREPWDSQAESNCNQEKLELISILFQPHSDQLAARCWRNPSARQQQSVNGVMWLVKGAPNLMQ